MQQSKAIELDLRYWYLSLKNVIMIETAFVLHVTENKHWTKFTTKITCITFNYIL